jgi:hypothetical protein
MNLRLVRPAQRRPEPDGIAPGESCRVQITERVVVELFCLAQDRTEATYIVDGHALWLHRSSIA